jgi:UDP-N-acetylmuramoyl-L-alanyl-D-glutamate--2,6-diaminopimelate ligase
MRTSPTRTVSLAELLRDVGGVAAVGGLDTRISDVVLDSRKVVPGALFAALRGERADGARFVPQAVEAWAAAVLCDEQAAIDWASLRGAVLLRAAAPREALALIARNFHGRPDDSLSIAAITGTNGKTTTAWMLAAILKEAGQAAGLLGTIEYRVGDRTIPADRTTPDSTEIYRLLAAMRDSGCRAAVLEVSSHALALDRVAGLGVDVALFTHLTHDHLDFHGTMDAYAAAKRRLFSERLRPDGVAIAGADDERAGWMLDAAPAGARRLTFGFDEASDLRIESNRMGLSGTDFRLRFPGGDVVQARSPLPGRPGVLNITAAVLAAAAMGVDPLRAIEIAARFPGAPGRFERVDRGQDFAVIVDYAHTDDALRNLLQSVREMAPRRVITVFGCGGDKDRTKRAPMGIQAMRQSDFVYLTSDNPRSEDPEAILRDAEAGLRSVPASSGRYSLMADRREAITAAIACAQPGDAVVIAGKGHETVQVLADRTIPFDDRLVAAEALSVRMGRAA